MEPDKTKHLLTIEKDGAELSFEVADYPHHGSGRCQFEIFRDNTFIASFEPDRQGLLHICTNPGKTDEETLHLIADKIEALHW